MFDWNDLRFFLTVARRIEVLEAALGLELFDKRRTGYVPTEAARDLLACAGEAEAALNAFETRTQEHRRGLTGVVRLTTNELLANQILGPALRQFRAGYPGLRLEIITDDRHLDLARGEADVALRAGLAPMEPELVGRRIARDSWSMYCSRDYAAAHGIPRSKEELAGHTVIGMEPGRYTSPLVDWLENTVPRSAIFLRRSSVPGLFADIRNGVGLSLMSDILAHGQEDFVYCFAPDVTDAREFWLLTHERLRDVPRVRAVLDFLSGHFAAHPAFKGR
jgi:DNA-binding transcriptional LysR family regulator